MPIFSAGPKPAMTKGPCGEPMSACTLLAKLVEGDVALALFVQGLICPRPICCLCCTGCLTGVKVTRLATLGLWG